MTELVRTHSQGNSATLYEAKTRLGKRVAVKELRESVRENPRLRDRVMNAAHQWAQHPHPNLLEYIDIDRDQAWIVMQWQSKSLASVSPCTVDVGLRILHQSLKALDHLNQAGFFHGNVKPSNILIGADGETRLSDGYVLSVNDPGVLPSASTSKYLAPELTTSPTAGPGVDLYALAFAVVEAMAGDRFDHLFPGISKDASDSDMAWIQWHTDFEAKLPPVSEMTDCPPDVAVVLDQMLSKNHHARYRFAQQVLADLDRLDGFGSLLNSANPTPISPAVTQNPAIKNPAIKQPIDNRDRHDHEPTQSSELPIEGLLVRPHDPIVLTVASGAEAGTTFSTQSQSFEVGFAADCDLTVSNEAEISEPDFRLRIFRGSNGWNVQQLTGNGFFINQSQAISSSQLRSGDLIRFSWRGPDVQFYLQSGSPSLAETAGKYLKKPTSTKQQQVAVADERGRQRASAARNRAQRGQRERGNAGSSQPADIRQTRVVGGSPAQGASAGNAASGPVFGMSGSAAGAAAPQRPLMQNPVTQSPVTQSPVTQSPGNQQPIAPGSAPNTGFSGSPNQGGQAPMAPVGPSAPRAPSPPGSPQAPVSPVAPSSPRAPGSPAGASVPVAPVQRNEPFQPPGPAAPVYPGVADQAAMGNSPLPPGGNQPTAFADPNVDHVSPGIKWSDPKTWDKPTKDKAMIGSAVVVAILVVLLFPTGSRLEPDADDETSTSQEDSESGATIGPVDSGGEPDQAVQPGQAAWWPFDTIETRGQV